MVGRFVSYWRDRKFFGNKRRKGVLSVCSEERRGSFRLSVLPLSIILVARDCVPFPQSARVLGCLVDGQPWRSDNLINDNWTTRQATARYAYTLLLRRTQMDACRISTARSVTHSAALCPLVQAQTWTDSARHQQRIEDTTHYYLTSLHGSMQQPGTTQPSHYLHFLPSSLRSWLGLSWQKEVDGDLWSRLSWKSTSTIFHCRASFLK